MERIPDRFELNTDGLLAYSRGLTPALAAHPGRIVYYARCVKVFRTPNGKWNEQYNRYEQPEVKEVRRERVRGNPDTDTASTCFAERLNTGIRQHTKKLARLTNAHAKKVEMLDASPALAFSYYNWVRPHAALGAATRAMAQALTDRRWTVADLVELLDAPPGEAGSN